MALQCVGELDLSPIAAKQRVDLCKVLATYNFHFWFDGSKATVVLDLDAPVVATVSVSGRTLIYAPHRVREDPVENLLWILGLEEDIGGFLKLASSDPLLAHFSRKWRGWRVRSCDVWWALVIGVCQQNASFRQGWRMLMNLVKIYGRRAELEGGGVILLPPRPIDVLKQPKKLLDAKLGYRARTVERVAKTVVENRIPSMSAMREFDAKDVEEILRDIKGVGAYTARLAMVLALRRYELVPMDRWLAALVAEAYGVDRRHAEEEWSARWGSWSGLASMALTVALDAAPLREALRRVKEGKVLPEGGLGPATLWRYSDL